MEKRKGWEVEMVGGEETCVEIDVFTKNIPLGLVKILQ